MLSGCENVLHTNELNFLWQFIYWWPTKG